MGIGSFFFLSDINTPPSKEPVFVLFVFLMETDFNKEADEQSLCWPGFFYNNCSFWTLVLLDILT